MKKGDLRKKKGFTIIEVSLVLAIAGLIFLMVFVALPQLQRQQRDSRRRDDILSFLETVKKYQTNNRGALPAAADGRIITVSNTLGRNTSWGKFYSEYLGDDFIDPDGTKYSLQVTVCNPDTNGKCARSYGTGGTTPPSNVNHQLYVVVQAKCADDESVGAVASSNPRTLAVLYKLEGAGIYCANT